MQDETKHSPDKTETHRAPESPETPAEARREQTATPQAPATEAPTPDEPVREEAPAGSEDPLARLEAEKAALEAERQDLKDQLLRALAEAENTRRRVERERGEAVKYAAVPLLRDLVRVADNLSRALAAVPAEAAEGNEQVKTLREGVALTERELMTAFQRHGVAKVEPLGEPLDPNLHEAMFEVPDAEKPAGTVVQVLEAGWTLHGRLVRPARVAVAKAP